MVCDALYVHIPFCADKCPYCDFYSIPATEELLEAYTRAVLRAFAVQPFFLSALDTVYFGGGTPSLLGDKRIARILDAARGRFGIRHGAEITVECNPGTGSSGLFAGLYDAGVTRLSFGMQSASDAQLRLLGRRHTRGELISSVSAAKEAGFAHISLDLMLAIPGQTDEDIKQAVTLCDALGAEHVSAYLLKIEDGTPFAKAGMQEQCPDEDGQARLYRFAVRTLAAFGYRQYEISNFARPGAVARHNFKYWDAREYLGIGPSAHSFVDGKRYHFKRDLGGFLAAKNPFLRLCRDGEGGDVEEYILLRARLAEGIRWNDLGERYPGYDPARLQKKARRLADGGLVILDSEGLRLTVDGFLLSNAVIGELLA